MKKHSLRIKEHSDPFCYLVESESNPTAPYLVDMTQRNGHGQCHCKHYQTKANPNFKRHGELIPYLTGSKVGQPEGVSECKHIARARILIHKEVTQPMLAKFKGE